MIAFNNKTCSNLFYVIYFCATMYTSEDCLRVVFNLISSTDSNDFLTSVLNPKMDTGCNGNNSNVVWVETLYLALQQ